VHPRHRIRRPAQSHPGDRAADTHDRVRTDTIDTNGVVTLRHRGQLYRIGVGRTHARTHVIMLIQDLYIRMVHAATGELLRDLTPQPRPQLPAHREHTPPQTTNTVNPCGFTVSSMS
jgi:hypothetical protein